MITLVSGGALFHLFNYIHGYSLIWYQRNISCDMTFSLFWHDLLFYDNSKTFDNITTRNGFLAWVWKITYLSDLLQQMFLRDAKQADVLLNQQDNFLSKEEVPVCTTVFMFIVYLPRLLLYLGLSLKPSFIFWLILEAVNIFYLKKKHYPRLVDYFWLQFSCPELAYCFCCIEFVSLFFTLCLSACLSLCLSVALSLCLCLSERARLHVMHAYKEITRQSLHLNFFNPRRCCVVPWPVTIVFPQMIWHFMVFKNNIRCNFTNKKVWVY